MKSSILEQYRSRFGMNGHSNWDRGLPNGKQILRWSSGEIDVVDFVEVNDGIFQYYLSCWR
ncbi:MAG: hypothetical protein JW902_19900 [Syntrophaceae bacterium]|nr:hypothetical protein [Syntrophaceae bacterium]